MLIAALLACTHPEDSDTAEPLPMGEPLEVVPGEWTWYDIEGTHCDDGSTTGIAVSPGTTNDVFVWMAGGGACWDYTTCFVANTASHGPFTAAQWSDRGFEGSVFDREDPSNPFRTYTMVFIPYCTGDLHGGDQMITYTQGTSDNARDYYHTGHANILRDLERLAPTFPTPDRVVVSGSSAGGGGTLLNYASFRAYWPDAHGILFDDSLPLLEGDAIQSWLREIWTESWHLQPLMDAQCPDCASDFSRLHVHLAEDYPDDRLALVTSLQDATISGYLLMSGEHYEEHLWDLDRDVLGPTSWERFFVNGDSHTVVGSPGRFHTEDGTELWPWLQQMVDDDPAWTSVGP